MRDFVNNPVPTIQEEVITLRIENTELKKELDSYKSLDSHYDEIEEDAKRIAEENETLTKRILELQKTCGTLTDKVEKMINFIYEEIDFCSYCPYENCKNDEGTCPYADVPEEEQKRILMDWLFDVSADRKMKNCKNCSYGMNGGCDYYNAVPDKVQNCEHWRLAE